MIEVDRARIERDIAVHHGHFLGPVGFYREIDGQVSVVVTIRAVDAVLFPIGIEMPTR